MKISFAEIDVKGNKMTTNGVRRDDDSRMRVTFGSIAEAEGGAISDGVRVGVLVMVLLTEVIVNILSGG